MKNQKGITLVALIITIIVMLILVAVTVAVVVDSDIIGQAEKAGDAYEAADDGLQHIGNTTNVIQGASKNRVQEYIDAVPQD